MIYLKSLIFLILVPGSAMALVPWLLVRHGIGRFEPGAWRWSGAPLLAAGAAALLWCFWGFARVGRGTPAPIAPPRKLVAVGLYRHVRNPMYVSGLAILAGETLLFGSWAIAAWAGVLAAFFHLFVVLYEEPKLRKLFGADYEAYVRSVPRWVPQVGRGGDATKLAPPA